jgi:hypothetical protein
MCAAIWLVVSDGQAKVGGDRNNSIVLRWETGLDDLADTLGLAKVSAFYDRGEGCGIAAAVPQLSPSRRTRIVNETVAISDSARPARRN